MASSVRQQFPELGDRVRRDAREHIAELGERLNSAPFAGSDEVAGECIQFQVIPPQGMEPVEAFAHVAG